MDLDKCLEILRNRPICEGTTGHEVRLAVPCLCLHVCMCRRLLLLLPVLLLCPAPCKSVCCA